MGALYGEMTRLSTEDYNKLHDMNIKASANAEAHGWGSLNVNSDASVDHSSTQNDTWSSIKKNINSYSTGASPPASGEPEEWEELTIKVQLSSFQTSYVYKSVLSF